MSKVNMAAVAFNGQEVQGLRETFYQSIFNVPALNQFTTLVSGVKAKQQIVFLGQLGLSGKKITGCDTVPNPSSVQASEKFWSPEYIGDRFEECFTNLMTSFWAYATKNGVQKPDLTNTDFALFLEDRIGIAAQEAVLRHAWLGNKSASVYHATTNTAGTLKPGIDPVYFTPINGLWVQALAIVAAKPAQRITLAANAGVSYAAQEFTQADIDNKVATKLLNSMVFKADMRLRAQTDKVLIVTQSLFDQYVQERQSVSSIDLAYDRVEGGIDTIKINGVDVIPFDFLDRQIRSYEDNGTKFNNPHRAILSTKSNLQVATEEEGNLTELDPFFDKMSKKYVIDYAFNLDAKIVEDHLLMAAY